MPESYIFLNDTGRQTSEYTSETTVTLEMTPVGFFENLTTFPLDVFTLSSFPKLSVKHKDTKDGPCLEKHIIHQNSVKGISANTKH